MSQNPNPTDPIQHQKPRQRPAGQFDDEYKPGEMPIKASEQELGDEDRQQEPGAVDIKQEGTQSGGAPPDETWHRSGGKGSGA